MCHIWRTKKKIIVYMKKLNMCVLLTSIYTTIAQILPNQSSFLTVTGRFSGDVIHKVKRHRIKQFKTYFVTEVANY